jgi:hypothetical protein
LLHRLLEFIQLGRQTGGNPERPIVVCLMFH